MDEVDVKRKLSPPTMNTSPLLETKRLKSTEEHHKEAESDYPSTQAQFDGNNFSASGDNAPKEINYGNVGNTVEMESQRESVSDTVVMDYDDFEDDPDMFDESLCFRSNSDPERCEFLRRVSDAILATSDSQGSDDIDGPSSLDIDGVDSGALTMVNIVTYLQDHVDPALRTEIAKYLSSGSLEFAKLSLDNIHHYFHVSACLHLKQLRDHCMNFCFRNNQSEIFARFDGCGCLKEVRKESSSGYQRSQSVISNPDDTHPPQYFIVFTDNCVTNEEKSDQNNRKITVKVIDMSEKSDIFNKEIDKVRQLGVGFACCSCEIKESPYVFVSGGAGNGKQMLKYDVLLGKWTKCSKLIHGRSNHMMISVGENSVFVISGTEVPCIEEYSIKGNKWVDRASLITKVTSAAVTCYRDKIYIFGGKTPAGPVAAVQCYDITLHDVKRLTDLPCAFDSGNCVVFRDKIYIATDDGHMICFDPATEQSSYCSQQPVHRRKFGMFVKNDRIYLVGGVLVNTDDVTEQKPQHRYNVEKDMWVEKYKLCENFPVLGSCIINYPKKCSIIPFNEDF